MAQIKDVEDVLTAVLGVMTAGLNTKVTAIETEKGALGLASIGADAYFEQTWSEKILNCDPAVLYTCEGVVEISNPAPGAVGKIVKISIYIIMVDNGQTNNVHKKVLRYSRAVEELFSGVDHDGFGKMKVEQILPVSWPSDTNTSEELKIGGVSLTIPLG